MDTVLLLAIALIMLFFLTIISVMLATRGEGSSRPAQRRHDAEFAPARDVYVVFQHIDEHTHYHDDRTDNRQVHVYGQLPPPRDMPLLGTAQQPVPPAARQFAVAGERQLYDPRTGEGRPL